MTNQPRIPDPETRARLLRSLRQTRLELEEFGLQLEEVIAGLEKQIREQKLQRIEKAKQKLK
ncbi:hypothetical protein NIES2119_16670 [[Phormidium ambiguum] IAM M-71]|uniref:Uncharacterized protein n=1 Tax=[Phormidium ambiguum] IAM M-71 TaxID=454136 RepID=A0A1U7IHY0_9CYAN|nr:hypothetical protein [Phormidium ambiguum]OKH36659.1 hypothetical protein NIES2119_16670 [Phormidium ambiguum IAM M-71]